MAQGAERLVGRTDELGQMEDALGELAQGHPAVIELVGEPGILFLSQKTVESHIRSMFRNLAVSSRAELARAIERAERA
jgi:hypothetical protein